MSTRTFALLAGIAYLGAGILGFLPIFLSPLPADAPPTTFTVLYGLLFGLFAVNILHSLVHVAIGAWGLASYAGRLGSPTTYARSLAVLYGALGVFGLIPGLNTVFGMVPLHGHDVWLHLGTAALATYFGWFAEPSAHERRGALDRRQAADPIARERRLALRDRRRHGGMYPA